MKKKRLNVIGVIGVTLMLAALIISGCAAPATPEPATPEPAPAPEVEVIRWRCQSTHSPGFLSYKTLEKLFDEIRIASGGRLEITQYAGGTLIPWAECFEAVSTGTLDSAIHGSNLFAGAIEPASNYWNASPGGFNGSDTMTWFTQTGAIEGYRDLLAEYNCHLAGYFGQGTEPINSTIPLRGVADLDGTKGREGGLFGDVVKAMGATPMAVPPWEIYTSLATGVIDWADSADMASNWDLGLQEVCPYLIFTPFDQTASMLGLIVNMDRWNELDDDLQTLVHMAMRAQESEFRQAAEWEGAEALRKHRDYGTEIITWPPEEHAKVQAIIEKLEAEKFRKLSPKTHDTIDQMHAFWEVFGPYKYATLGKKPYAD